jgi:hypothetical protein
MLLSLKGNNHILLFVWAEMTEYVIMYSEYRDKLLVNVAKSIVLHFFIVIECFQYFGLKCLTLKKFISECVGLSCNCLCLFLMGLKILHSLNQIGYIILDWVIMHFRLQGIVEPLNFSTFLLQKYRVGWHNPRYAHPSTSPSINRYQILIFYVFTHSHSCLINFMPQTSLFHPDWYLDASVCNNCIYLIRVLDWLSDQLHSRKILA